MRESLVDDPLESAGILRQNLVQRSESGIRERLHGLFAAPGNLPHRKLGVVLCKGTSISPRHGKEALVMRARTHIRTSSAFASRSALQYAAKLPFFETFA